MMKNILKTVGFSALLVASLFFYANAQTGVGTIDAFKVVSSTVIAPRVSTNSFRLPYLGSAASPCLYVKDTAGNIASTTCGASTNPAGSDMDVQYNDNGSFGADGRFRWDANNGILFNDVDYQGNTATFSGGTNFQSDINVNGGFVIFTADPGTIRIDGGEQLKITGGTDTDSVILDKSLLTTDRTFRFPNASGTLALTSDIVTTSPGGSNKYIQVNENGAFGGYSDFTFTSSTKSFVVNGSTTLRAASATSTPLIVMSTSTTPGADIVQIFATSTQAAFFVDKNGDTHIGKRDAYSCAPFTYQNSSKLFFGYSYNGTDQSNYIETVPNLCGGQNQATMDFYVSNQKQFTVSGVSGPGAPLGMTAGGWVIGAGGSTLMRTSNTSAGTIRGEFNTITIQAEHSTAGEADVILLGKNPFGTPSVGRLVEVQNNSVAQAYFNTYGGLVLNEAATSSAASDLQVKTQPNANALRVVASSGFVGIATSTPSANLHVDGSVKFTASSTIVTPTIGGSALLAGACSSATSTIDSVVSSSTAAFITTPQNDPGDGFFWNTILQSAGVAKTRVCASVAGTPTATPFVVKIIN